MDQTKMSAIREAFQRYDADNSGSISTSEADQVLRKELGFSAETTKKLIDMYDINKDGTLSYEEFVGFYKDIQFKKFDRNQDGSISKEEFREHGMSDANIEKLFKIHDTNQDGKIQYEEFAQFWDDAQKVTK